MHIYVVNLDRSEDRLREFRRVNSHMPGIQRFSAVDGATIDRGALVDANTISAELRYTNGALGCALSHIFFWEAAMAEKEEITVCEDDAIFHHRFLELAPRLIASLPSDWGLVMWGWNFDSILWLDLMPGISPCLATFDQDQMRKAADDYQRQNLSPFLFPLLRSYGTVCYTVSPTGAKRLLENGLPLRPFTLPFPTINPQFPNNGIDIVMNSLYSSIHAYVSFPPLVITKNDHGVSTVR
jgi:GR25 family glycosyltransferase involved in LPS biosynthesis